jgi:hypothetical protein
MDGKPATAFRLAQRLFELGAIESEPDQALTAQQARDVILSYCCTYAVCDRINNKVATFAQYYEAVFGEPLEIRATDRR